jgi:hypothetical protein
VSSIVASTLPFPPSPQVLPSAAELDVVDVAVWIALDRFRSLQSGNLRWSLGERKSLIDRMGGYGDEMVALRESWVGRV